MTRFDTYLRTMLDDAATEARLDGSTSVEAQHLLLAMAADADSTVGLALATVGLDRDGIRVALDREFAYSLSTVGIALSEFTIAVASPDPERLPQPGASVQLALERGLKSVRGRDPQPAHLLLGILEAEVGTVARALAQAGVDRGDLLTRVRETLT